MDTRRFEKKRNLLSAVLLAVLSTAVPLRAAHAHHFGGLSELLSELVQALTPDPTCGSAGDPVSVFSGRWYHEQTDLVVPGVFPIEMVRSYDSQSTYDSPLGYGWSLNYDYRLFTYPDGSVTIRQHCGVRHKYVLSGNAFVRPVSTDGNLKKNADGVTYTLTFPRGRRFVFDSNGSLSRIYDAFGNSLRLTYSAGKRLLTGKSPHAVDPTVPIVVASVYQLTRIEEYTADEEDTGRLVTLSYDAATGRLESLESSDGRSVSYEHDPSGNLTQVDGLEDITTTYLYEDSDIHNVTSFTSGGVTPIRNFYSNDRVMTQEWGRTTYTFAYTTAPPMTVVTQTTLGPSGNTPLHVRPTIYEFDDQGYTTRVTDALGNHVVFTRDVRKNAYVEEEYEARPVPFGPIRTRRVDTTFNSDGFPVTREILLAGETVKETWTYALGGQGWVESYRIESNLDPQHPFQTEFSFNRSGPEIDDPITSVSAVKAVSAWSGQSTPVPTAWETTSFEYDPVTGQPTTIIPPAVSPDDGLRLKRQYFGSSSLHPGRLSQVYLEVNGVADPHLQRSFTYDTHGFLNTMTDARGNGTLYLFDDLGRLRQVRNPLQEWTLFTYTGPNDANPDAPPAGNLLTKVERGKTSLDGQITRFRHDPLGRLVLVERKDATGFSVFETRTLDSDGRPLSITDAVDRPTRISYDVLGRPSQVTDPSNANPTTFEYDGRGNRTAVVDGRGVRWTSVYDALDRVAQQIEDDGGLELTTQFAYDAADNVLSVTDPEGHVTSYTYDRSSRRTSMTQQMGEQVTYSYDGRGRPLAVVNARNQAQRYFYQPWGRLDRIEFDNDNNPSTPPSRTYSYAYDASGNLRSVADTALASGLPAAGSELLANRLYSYSYDVLDRVASVDAHIVPGSNSTLAQIRSRYDRFGNRNEMDLIDGVGTAAYSWTFDPRFNRLSQATLPEDANPPTLGFTYEDNDDLETLTHGNGLVSEYAYYAQGPIQTISAGTTPTHELDYASIDAALNIRTVRETVTGTQQNPDYRYGYDNVNRLTSAEYPSSNGLPGSETFGYDKAGNRDDDPNNASPWSYDDNNRLIASPSSPLLCYNADGALTSKRSTGDCVSGTASETFTFDPLSRMTRYQRPADNKNVTYSYDPFGRRIRKLDLVTGATTYYVWDGEQLLAEYDVTQARKVRYAYANGFSPVQVAYRNGGAETVYDVHSDHLGTPKLLTVSSGPTAGTVAWRAGHQAFGQAALAGGNAVTFNVRFPGQYFDEESGLHYNRFRYYDPAVGRYISADPIGQAGGNNVYTYAALNPLGGADPFGLLPCLPDISNAIDTIAAALAVAALAAALVNPASAVAALLAQAALYAAAFQMGWHIGMALATGDLSHLSQAMMIGALLLVGPAVRAVALAAMSRVVSQGIYQFTAATGNTYVGQSGNIAARIAQHLASGKLTPGNLQTLKTTEVLGGKTAREVAEQLRILDLGGIRNLENLRNPIGPGRAHLLPDYARAILGY